MKRLFLFVAIHFTFLSVNSQNSLQTVDVPIGGSDLIIASVVAPNNHLYVFTAPEPGEFESGKYKLKGKVTLMHFDENKKLVQKKPLTVPMIGGAKILIDAAFVMGNQLIVFGSSENRKSMRTSGFFTVDQTTLIASKKPTTLFESSSAWSGIVSPNKFQYSQSVAGGPIGVHIVYYLPKQKISRYDGFTSSHSRYFTIDESLVAHEVLKFDHESSDEDRTPEDFVMSATGKLHILTSIYPHTDYDWEAFELTKASKNRIMNGEYTILLTSVDVSGSGRENIEIKYADAALFIDQGKLECSGDSVFVIGTATNNTSNYIRKLKDDTAGLTYKQFLFSQQIDFSKSPMIISNNSCAQIDEKEYDRLTKVNSLTEEDRDIGNKERVILMDCNRQKDGTALFSYVVYVEWRFPPYEEIKNDPKYSFEKDDEGHIVRITSTDVKSVNRREYKSLLTFKFVPGSNTLTTGVKELTMVTESERWTVPTSVMHIFYTRTSDMGTETYFAEPSGTDMAKLICSNSENGNETLMRATNNLSIAECSRFTLEHGILLLQGKNEFMIADVKN